MKIIHCFKWITILYFFFFSSIYGQNWSPVGGGVNLHVRAFYPDSLDDILYLAGKFKYAGGEEVNGITKWDGEGFSPLGTGSDDCINSNCPSFTSIAKYKNEIYCSYQGYKIGGVSVASIAKWDGTKWDSVLGGITHLDGNNGLVWKLLVHEDELYIMGRFSFGDDVFSPAIVKWNGEEYSAMNFPYIPPMTNNDPLIVAAIMFNGELYAGGQFSSAPGIENQIDVARFDGDDWYPVGGGIKGAVGDVNDLFVYDDELYVCGNFRKSNGNAGNGIMKLKNDQWVDVGGSFDEETSVVHQMIEYHGDMYVFGTFNYVGGGLKADNIAKWDGEKWCDLGNTFDQRIECATVFHDSIFIGGWFNTIDNDSIGYLAKWTGDYVDSCANSTVLYQHGKEIQQKIKVFPIPVYSTLNIEIENGVGYSNLSVRNVLGGRKYFETLFTTDITRAIDVSTWPPGLYLLTLESGGQHWTEKVIIHH